ncbi:MAG TPA: hypothetical protein VNB94_01350 [Mycobacteriales bacterium]|nr:hypothetical protein [Mycobacteriales bacterium]
MSAQETTEQVRGWFTGRLPTDWFTGAPEVTVDREEILVVGTLAEPSYADGAGEAERQAARAGRAKGFREDTRAQRMTLADEAERRTGRKVAWGVRVGEEKFLFTTLSVPVMTRLRQPERLVLDTLVDAGVARSRSDALAWSVKLVAQHQGEWIDGLRVALAGVEQARAGGPDVGTG